MNRLFYGAMCCAALAGCVREGASDLRATSQDNVVASTQTTERAAQAAAPAPQSTGSRLLPSPETLSDPFITGRIKAELVADPSLRGADVSVTTTQGVVSLTGLVASQEQAAIASAHAQGQDGVMRVDNHLAVNLQ